VGYAEDEVDVDVDEKVDGNEGVFIHGLRA
jgi:hypothetical protein